MVSAGRADALLVAFAEDADWTSDKWRIFEVLQNYLRLERPLTNSPSLFVSLKGRQRGRPMTAAGLRSLFRHHRLASKVPQANPHRFRTIPASGTIAECWRPFVFELKGPAQSADAAREPLGIVFLTLQIIQETKELVPGSIAYEFALQRYGFAERLFFHRKRRF